MTQTTYRLTPSLAHEIATTSLRLVPPGKTRAFVDGQEVYRLFMALYRDSRPTLTYSDFQEALRQVFPVYKNPRGTTFTFKITAHSLVERMAELGVRGFSVDRLLKNESLKISKQCLDDEM